MLHDLKISHKYFDAVANGIKCFEVRKNDRPFKVGDTLRLREFDPDKKLYTGRETERTVTYILCDEEYYLPGYVIMSLK